MTGKMFLAKICPFRDRPLHLTVDELPNDLMGAVFDLLRGSHLDDLPLVEHG